MAMYILMSNVTRPYNLSADLYFRLALLKTTDPIFLNYLTSYKNPLYNLNIYS